jgi:hypothetical protein
MHFPYSDPVFARQPFNHDLDFHEACLSSNNIDGKIAPAQCL